MYKKINKKKMIDNIDGIPDKSNTLTHKITGLTVSIPLSSQDIRDSMDGKVKVIRYGELSEYNNIDDLLYPYGNVAILYQTKPNYGHWTCIFKRKVKRDEQRTKLNNFVGYKRGTTEEIEFFDPYGIMLDDELEFIPYQFRVESNQVNKYLTNLLMKSKYPININHIPFQELKDGVNSCGRHVCLRMLLKNMSLKDYTKIFMSGNQKIYGGTSSDNTVSLLSEF